MKDGDKLREYTDAAGNLRVDRLRGLRLRHVSVLPFGANGREVAATREASQVPKTKGGSKILRQAGNAQRIVNWVADGEVPAAVQNQGRALYAQAIERGGGTEILRKLHTDLHAVLGGELLYSTLSLYGNALNECVLNCLWSSELEDKRGAIEAAMTAHHEAVMELLDAAEQFEMTRSPGEIARSGGTDMPIDREVQAALDALKSDLAAAEKRAVERADKVGSVTEKAGALLAAILRENGLEDNYLTQLLGQFSIQGNDPVNSKLGDVTALFGRALGGAMSEALVTMGNVMRASKRMAVPTGDKADEKAIARATQHNDAAFATEARVVEMVREAGGALVKDVLGKVSDLMRGRRGTPPGAPTPRQIRNPDKVLPGVSGLAASMATAYEER